MPSSISPEHRHALRQLVSDFSDLPEFRQPGKLRHPLGEVVTIAFCSMVCGMAHFTDMETFADDQEDWLRQFLDLPHGVPSHDTFQRVFSHVSASGFVEILSRWGGFDGNLAGKHVPIDGKTLSGTGIHLVRAWVDELGLSVGQVCCEEKSNEIEAIPRLLDALEIKGAVISIDAMGCQCDIATHIHEKGAHYLLALKGNQKQALQAVSGHLGQGEQAPELVGFETEALIRGRYEHRTCWVETDLSFFDKSWKWEGLTCVARVRSEVCRHQRRNVNDAETTVEDRYYLCSLPLEEVTAEKVLELARSHWSVENRCHWMLDVVFGEDDCPIREKTAAKNLSSMRGMVMALLKKDSAKGSLKSKQNRAALNSNYRAQIIAKFHA